MNLEFYSNHFIGFLLIFTQQYHISASLRDIYHYKSIKYIIFSAQHSILFFICIVFYCYWRQIKLLKKCLLYFFPEKKTKQIMEQKKQI